MNNFLKYLQLANSSQNNLERYKKVELVLGNESCDLDSTISTLLLGFFLYSRLKLNDTETIVIPVLNVSKENFILRTENVHVLSECNIDYDKLIYRNQIDLNSLVVSNKLRTHLVDHHVLSNNDLLLENTVVEIFDHRPYDESAKWSNITLKLKEVGSCATLIADEILTNNPEILTKELAFLLYKTIVFDTVALVPENGRVKSTDIEVATKLEEKFKFDIGRQDLFNQLWAAHNDVSHLTAKQLLAKDLKFVEGIPVPGLPMLFQDYIKLHNAYSHILDFANEHNASLVVFIGLDAKKEVRRDIGLFSNDHSKELKQTFIDKLLHSDPSLDLEEMGTEFAELIYFKQKNYKLTRKHIIPILKDSILKYK